MRRVIFGKNKFEAAYLPIEWNGSELRVAISTRRGDVTVEWGDGSVSTVGVVKNTDATVAYPTALGHNYGYLFNGIVKLRFHKGKNDVYSLYFGGNPVVLTNTWDYFINQFPSLYSINIDQPHNGESLINGQAENLPDSVEKFIIHDLRNSGQFTLNLSNFAVTSKLKMLSIGGGQYQHDNFGAITGDLAKLPPNIYFFKLFYYPLGSDIYYSGGKVWPSEFDTLYIPISLGPNDIDNLLIDMAASITTAIGQKKIDLWGERTANSDAAVAYLESIGFQVMIHVLEG